MTTTERWDIADRSGFAHLRIGDHRVNVRNFLGEFRTFRRTPNAAETDQFISGAMVTYDSDDRVTFIEVTAPAQPTLLGVPLIGRSLDKVIQELEAKHVGVVKDRDGARIRDWAIGLYAPIDRVEGASIGG